MGFRTMTPQQLMDEARSVPERRAPVLPDTYQSAVKTLANSAFLNGLRWEEQQARANRHDADVDILAFERSFIRMMSDYEIPMFAHCVVRSMVEQRRAYEAGFHSRSSSE